MSRLVNCNAATMEFRFGWLVEPDIDATARSATSTPASAALNTEAAAMPLVSCVWKCTGMPISSFSAFTSTPRGGGPAQAPPCP